MTKNAHLKCTIMSEESVIRIIKDFSAFNAVGIAGNFDNFAVMNQTVNNGVCDDSVVKHISPFRKRLISGKNSRSATLSAGIIGSYKFYHSSHGIMSSTTSRNPSLLVFFLRQLYS